MDEQSLNELLECSVCLDRLDHTSKVLPCQHTFCRRCLEEIVSTKGELRCPECRFLVEVRVEDLPSNILLIRLLEGIKTKSCTDRTRSPDRYTTDDQAFNLLSDKHGKQVMGKKGQIARRSFSISLCRKLVNHTKLALSYDMIVG